MSSAAAVSYTHLLLRIPFGHFLQGRTLKLISIGHCQHPSFLRPVVNGAIAYTQIICVRFGKVYETKPEKSIERGCPVRISGGFHGKTVVFGGIVPTNCKNNSKIYNMYLK